MHGDDAVEQDGGIAAATRASVRTLIGAERLAAGLPATVREAKAGLLASKRTALAANRRSIFSE